MRRSLTGRRLIITGASSGIGRALAIELARCGSSLILVARSGDKLASLAAELAQASGTIVTVTADITVAQDRERIIETAEAELGGIDGLINNAGVGGSGHFISADEALMRQTFETNFFGPVELTRLAVPLLTSGTDSFILNVASMCGRRGMPAWPEYSASKFALCGFTESMRAEFARFDIDVLLVLPGLVNSEFSQHHLRDDAKVKTKQLDGLPPQYVAEKIRRAIERNATETVLGGDAKWMIRLNRWFPRIVDRLISRRVRQLYQTEVS